MKTPADNDYPEIEWEQSFILSEDIDEREEVWCMTGKGIDMKNYIGIGIFSCGGLVHVEEIELAD